MSGRIMPNAKLWWDPLHIQGLEKPTQELEGPVVGTGSDRKNRFHIQTVLPILCHFLLWFPDLSFVFTAVKSLDSWTTSVSLQETKILLQKIILFQACGQTDQWAPNHATALWGWRLYYAVSSAWFSVCLTSLVQPLLPQEPPALLQIFILLFPYIMPGETSHNNYYYCCLIITLCSAAALQRKKKKSQNIPFLSRKGLR